MLTHLYCSSWRQQNACTETEACLKKRYLRKGGFSASAAGGRKGGERGEAHKHQSWDGYIWNLDAQ